jgi:hypothetical protein
MPSGNPEPELIMFLLQFFLFNFFLSRIVLKETSKSFVVQILLPELQIAFGQKKAKAVFCLFSI